MILYENGRYRTIRPPEEERELLKKEFKALTPDELEALKLMLIDLGIKPKSPRLGDTSQVNLIEAIGTVQYKRTPVDITTFFKDPYYLGKTCGSSPPVITDAIHNMFSGGYTEAILTGSVGYGKCLSGDTEIFDAKIGRRRTLREASGSEVTVPTMIEAGKMGYATGTVFKSGIKKIARLTLESGESVEASLDHPFFTSVGWKKLSELEPGVLLATPRIVKAPEQTILVSDAFVRCVAYMMADGGTTSSSNSFTNTSSMLLEELDADFRCLSKDKRVPPQFYTLPDRQIALFLNRFWACDGSITRRQPYIIEIILASEGLIDDIKFLLLRLGIHSIKSYKKASILNKATGTRTYFDAWRLTVTGIPDLKRFLDCVGPVLGKEDRCNVVANYCRNTDPNPNVDVLPISMEDLRKIRKELNAYSKIFYKKWAFNYDSLMSRLRFQRLCSSEAYSGSYAWLATSDLFWSPIKSIEPLGSNDVYDLCVPGTNNFVANGIIVHNSFLASMCICRVLYELSCMTDPQKAFGLESSTSMSILILSVTETQAIKVAFDYVASKLVDSPYFQDNFPFKRMKKELLFPNKITINAVSTTDTSALGTNPISSFMDEANFLAKPVRSVKSSPGVEDYDQAETIYNALKIRMKSRYERRGRLPGLLILVSSKQTVEDFVERRLNEAVEQKDPTIYALDTCLWEVRPDDFDLKNGFDVLCGNETTLSRILDSAEAEGVKANKPEGTLIIRVPAEFKPDFERNIERAIRDLAGLSTAAVHPFIQRREKIKEACRPGRKHPFSTLNYDMSKGGGILWHELVRVYEERQGGSKVQAVKPTAFPNAVRHAHIDLALRKDSAGLTLGCVCGWKDVERRTQEGVLYFERAPVYWIDLMLEIVPPVGGEIIIGEIRRIIYELSAHGFIITLVTADQYNSADTLQQMRQHGYKAELLSVDVTPEPYEVTKTALYEDRLILYDYSPVEVQLRGLEWNARRKKVDHGPKGKKDVSDALAGTVFSLSQAHINMPLPIISTSTAVQGMWVDPGHASLLGSPDNPLVPASSGSGLPPSVHLPYTSPFSSPGTAVLPPIIMGTSDGDDWGGGGGWFNP